MSQAKREYAREIQSFLRKLVLIALQDRKTWSGMLLAITTETTGFVVLGKAKLKDSENNIILSVHKVFININEISSIVVEDAPFDLVGLTTDLEKVLKNLYQNRMN